jgi:hypothetical protein
LIRFPSFFSEKKKKDNEKQEKKDDTKEKKDEEKGKGTSETDSNKPSAPEKEKKKPALTKADDIDFVNMIFESIDGWIKDGADHEFVFPSSSFSFSPPLFSLSSSSSLFLHLLLSDFSSLPVTPSSSVTSPMFWPKNIRKSTPNNETVRSLPSLFLLLSFLVHFAFRFPFPSSRPFLEEVLHLPILQIRTRQIRCTHSPLLHSSSFHLLYPLL